MAPSRDPLHRGVVEVLAAAVLFGTTGTSASFAPPAASAVSIGAARLVVGGGALLALLPRLGGDRAAAIRMWRTPWGLLAGVMTAVYQLAFFAGVANAGVALGTLVTIGSGPVFVGLLAWLVRRERPTVTWLASTAVCIAGLALLTLDGSGRPGVDPGALWLPLAAGASYAAYTVAAKRGLDAGVPPQQVMASAFGLGAVLMLPVLLLSSPGWLLSVEGAAVAAWLGLVTTSLAYLLFGNGLRVLPAAPAATLVLAEPLVATLLGVVVLGERPGPAGWLGAALVTTGLVLGAMGAVRSRPQGRP